MKKTNKPSLVKKAKKELVVLKTKFKNAETHVKKYMHKNPEKAALIAAGIGAAVGAAVAAGVAIAIKRKKQQ